MSFVALVLAAGAGTRFGGDKLSAQFGGEPLLFHAIRSARAAPVSRVVVIASADLEIGTWDGQPPVEVVRVTSAALSSSLKTGIAAVQGSDGAFIFLGDMPRVPPDEAGKLAALIGCNYAAIPRHAGRPGHPVLLSARAFPDVAKLTGDRGAGPLLHGRTDVVFDDCHNAGVVFDVDRPEDLE